MFVVIGIEVVENKVKNAGLLFLMELLEVIKKVFEEEGYEFMKESSFDKLCMFVLVKIQNVVGWTWISISHCFRKILRLNMNIKEHFGQ